MTEAVFQTEIREAVKHLYPAVFFFKIPDLRGTKKTHPFDCFFIVGGAGYALELKQTRNYEPFPFAAVKEHQVDGLIAWEQAGGKSYILINQRISDGDVKVNRCLAISLDSWLTLIKGAREVGIKSMSMLRLEAFGKLIPREKIGEKTTWNLTLLLE